MELETRVQKAVNSNSKQMHEKSEPGRQAISEKQKDTYYKQGDKVWITNRVAAGIFNRKASSVYRRATVRNIRLDEKGKIEKVFSQEDRRQEVEVPGDTEDIAVPDDEAEDKGVMGIASGIQTRILKDPPKESTDTCS